MEFKIQHRPEHKVAGFHMVGPWEQSVHQGFEQLALWVKSHNVPVSEWLAVYYDNPDEVPAEKLRCDTVIRVPEEFEVPENSEGVIVTHIAGGEYAVARVRIEDNDFAGPWRQFFGRLAADEHYQMTGKPCFEHYLNDGSENGVWELDMYVPVAGKR
ncbi:DNA gyrase inhibitor SbmC [Dryocola sp. BD613]|uniref:DNA gyrase inhibitor SbmC n=1 Tax=Dryocola sp. BD613 TaxID=3133272 RepID=UPI003F50797E